MFTPVWRDSSPIEKFWIGMLISLDPVVTTGGMRHATAWETIVNDSISSSSLPTPFDANSGKEGGLAALGTVASFSAVLAAAACCVLPAALAALGVGAGLSGGFSRIVPLHWPLTIVAIIAVALGWIFHARRRKLCLNDATCTRAPPTKATLIVLCMATAFVGLSAIWPLIEAPLTRAIGQA